MRPFSRQGRSGFALLAVLWILVGVSVVALAMNVAGRDAVLAAQNRLSGARARWVADGCLERARAAIGDIMAGRATWTGTPVRWTLIDRAVLASPYLADAHCDLRFRATGVALDVNSADTSQLRSLFRVTGLAASTADSLTDAVVAWRSPAPRPSGPRSLDAWYGLHHRPPPRHGAFVDVAELHRVRGFDQAVAQVPALDTLLTAEPGRIVLDLAPPAVLATLPGMTDEALARLAERRSQGLTTGNLLALTRELSPAGALALTGRYIDLLRLIGNEPEAWLVTARATAGVRPAVPATIDLRLVKAGDRVAIVRRRVWP